MVGAATACLPSELLKHLKTPGLEVSEIFKKTGAGVSRRSGEKQIPAIYSQFFSEAYLTDPSFATVPGDAPSIGVIIEQTYDALKVSAKTTGKLYLDGQYMVTLPAGQKAALDNIPTGSHKVEIRYDGGTEKKTVTVTENRTMNVGFSWVERPSVPEDFVLVEGGTFKMGSTGGDDDEEPVHTVEVDDFALSKYEVTVGEFREFVQDRGYRTDAETGGGAYVWIGSEWEQRADANWRNPSFSQSDTHPVVAVGWYDAVRYCNWLSEKEGLTPAYTIRGENVSWKRNGTGYRLPTEAEWEFAAPGGNAARGYKYSGSNGLGGVAWYDDNSGGKTHPVGGKRANELGLYDMSGNVWEWCWDWYDDDYYEDSPREDPAGPSSGSSRVLRGGSWGDGTAYLRVANRGWYSPGDSLDGGGFRVVAPATAVP